jgi:hypothetical protein
VKLACIVLAHRGPEQLAQLLGALQHPAVAIYLHVDSRASWEPFGSAIERAGVADVQMIPRRPTRWGGREVVDASLDGLRAAVHDGSDYVCLVSGQDFPLRGPEQILGFLEQAPERSYVGHWELPADHWRFGGRDRTDFYTYTVRGRRETCIPRGYDMSTFNWRGHALNWALRVRSALKPARRFPPYLRPVGGSQWWNLSRAAADHVIRFVDDHPDYVEYHEHTILPDEMFFQSILVGGDYDGEVENDALRFMLWDETESHPQTLTSADLPAMRATRDLFARKFDAVVDAAVIAELAGSQRP